MDHNVVPIFTSPIIQTYVKEDTSELLDHDEYTVSSEYRDDYEKSTGSRRVLEKYPKTKKILLNIFTSLAEEVIGYKKREYAITTSWFTLCNRGEGSQLHYHKNSFWSCVYYYQAEYGEGSGGITFENPNSSLFDYFFEKSDIAKPNYINAMSCLVAPSPNLLLIFPSYLQHKILKHNSDKPRSSLAFNIIPLGRWGNGDSCYDQAWITLSS